MRSRTASVNTTIASAPARPPATGVRRVARPSMAECATPTAAPSAAEMDMGVPLGSEQTGWTRRRLGLARKGLYRAATGYADGALGRGRPAAYGSSRRGTRLVLVPGRAGA